MLHLLKQPFCINIVQGLAFCWFVHRYSKKCTGEGLNNWCSH